MIDVTKLKMLVVDTLVFGIQQLFCLDQLQKFLLTGNNFISYQLAENGGAYWLLDAIASWQKELNSSQIQFWMLIVNADNSAVLTCERDDEPVITQQIPFTDFPLSEVTLWLCDGVLLLSSEY